MTDIFKTPEKFERKRRLFQIGLGILRSQGWKIERQSGGKSSVRAISRANERHVVAIRTTQDQWIAFARRVDDKGWATLGDVDVVLVVSVDDVDRPTTALVHWVDAEELRNRFDRNYQARRKAGHQVPLERGVWLPLYIRDDRHTARYAGGGAGLDHPPIARVPLDGAATDAPTGASAEPLIRPDAEEKPLTIAEAKRRLARSLGVAEANIKISVEA